MELELKSRTQAMLDTLIRSGRMPHTVIIESRSSDERAQAARYLAAAALCRGGAVPCMGCSACAKVFKDEHPDVIIPVPSKNLKTGILSVRDLRRDYLSREIIAPNEAALKVFIFNDADRLLREDSQNTLLKSIEDPPCELLFIFTVEKLELMLPTVRSRAHLLRLDAARSITDEAQALAAEIAAGIVSLYEYDLLRATSKLTKANIEETLAALCESLRLAMAFFAGVRVEDPVVGRLTQKLTRERILALYDVTCEAASLSKTNLNITLLHTWLCTQYRRISWQK